MSSLAGLAASSGAGARAACELAAFAREAVRANVTREVLHLHAAALALELRRPHHRRLLEEALGPLRAAARTRVFDLPNGDIVAIAPPPAEPLEAAREGLLRLLDPAAVGEGAVRSLRLPGAAARLVLLATDSLGLNPPALPPMSPRPPGAPLDIAALAAAERALAGADLESVTSAQTVCRLEPGGTLQRLWEERRVDWSALGALLLPGVDLGTAPALRRRLARLLELRLLAASGRPQALLQWRPFGVALAPSAVAAPGFQRFDAALPAGRRAEVTISFRVADILADPEGYAFARGFLRDRGYRLAAEEVAPERPAPLLTASLGVDLLRLRWSPGLLSVGAPTGLADTGVEPILAGVDRPGAIAWGWENGVRLFQGPLIEACRRMA